MSLRDQFVAGLQKLAVPLVPVEIEGLPTFYTRGLTVKQTRQQLAAPEEQGTLQERVARDPHYLDRRVARVVLDENGSPLFDEHSDEDMRQLRAVLEVVPPDIQHKILTAAQKQDEPTAEEATGPN